ncbi:MAG: hypothetical protein ABSG41_22170 [Bryobacteraceae bacterium]|jgi:hypothetical protein
MRALKSKVANKGRVAPTRHARESIFGQSPFRKWRGALGGFPSGINEINAWIREMRGRRTPDKAQQLQ